MQRTLSLAVMLLAFLSATAQTGSPDGTVSNRQTPLVIAKITESVKFDGVMDESFWDKATDFPVTRQTPDYESKPSEETDLRMFYNDEYIWFGARLYFKDPKKIQDFSKQRDGGGPMDYIAFAFDGYNDKTNGLAFATTPSGLRWDASILFNSNGVNIDANWNTYWEVKTSRDEKGWYAEFKLPLSSLRFNAATEDVLMNFIAWRILAYNNEIEAFPNIPPKWGVLSFANIAEGQPIIFKGIKNSNPLYVTPYLLGGISSNQLKNQTNTGYNAVAQNNFNAGFDLKYSLSSQITLDVTMNTDFAQAEVDNFQVNLTRASLFFPEKREFFLERTGNFSFGFDGNNDAFYSRRIGLENGDISRIYGGGRLSGRINRWDIGLLNMQTEDISNGGSKNLGLARVKKQLGKNNSYAGAVFSSSIGKGRNNFYTYGTDGLFKLPLKSYLKFAVAKTTADSVSKSFYSADNLRLSINIQIPDEAGFNYYLGYGIVGSGYDPALGFEERGNIRSYNGRIGYGIFTTKSKKIFKHLLKLAGYRIDGFTSANKESAGIEFSYLAELKNGTGFTVRPFYNEEVLSRPLVLSSNVSIPSGSYHYNGIKWTLNSPVKKPLNISLSSDMGRFYNGKKLSASTAIRWDGSRLVQILANYRYDYIRFENGIPSFENHLASLSTILNFTTKLSINSLFQYDYLHNRVGGNIRLRYNAKEGNDLFIVVTNIGNTDRFREMPVLPALQSWLALVKYKHTFLLKKRKR